VILLKDKLPDDGYILPGVGDLSQSLTEATKLAMGISAGRSISRAGRDGLQAWWVLSVDNTHDTPG